MKQPLLTLLLFLVGTGVTNAEVLRPVNQRFAAAEGKEVPDFQRHVVPLLGRLGCNGRACHGSFQGQGGFRLSLFGYDFKADHNALVGGEKPRVNRQQPATSLLLRKPTRQVAHRGGKRFELGGWEHHLLLRWLNAGAPEVPANHPTFSSLEVEPAEIVFSKTGETRQLRVVAHWSNGLEEDVTPLCRFRSNDESIAVVDEAGLITSSGKGGTAVVAFYDNGVVPVQVILPVSEQVGAQYPAVPTATRIDELVVARLRKLAIVPSELCSDVEFLRRVSLDLTGTIPLAEEVTAFLADTGADKRARKIEELLGRPTYAAWWTTRLCDWTGNAEATGPLGGERGLNGEKSKQWYRWLHQRVRSNVPYDQLVEGIVLATSRKPEQSYESYCAEMSSYFRKNNRVDFATRDNLPQFWMRKQLGKPEGKALAFAHAFLGVSLQCAECHKHPYDQWTKQDFDQFAAFFIGIGHREGNRDQARAMKAAVGLTGDPDSGAYARQFVKLAEAGKVLPYRELFVPPPIKQVKGARAVRGPAGRVLTPRLLGGEEVIARKFGDPRLPLMNWLREAENPYFARAFVNRVWACYFNIGLIDPPDDLNLANPPSNPALLDYLASEFVRSGYDMRALHRQIVSSRTYQLSWKTTPTNQHDERNYSHAVVRRLPAEVLYDALAHATAGDASLQALHADPVSQRAIGVSSGLVSRKGEGYAINLFGRPARTINCDCERSSEPSLLQTVYLRNDQEILKLLDRPEGWLRQTMKAQQKPEALVRQAYLRVLSRPPDQREGSIALRHLQATADTTAGLRDLLWTLLNTREFIVNR